MKRSKSEPATPPASALTSLDPSHPNYDAILLKRARLEAHRRRRAENRGLLAPRDHALVLDKPGTKRARRSKD